MTITSERRRASDVGRVRGDDKDEALYQSGLVYQAMKISMARKIARDE